MMVALFRDILLNLTPNKFDICTNALSFWVLKSLFKSYNYWRSLHIKIFFENTWFFEITTF